VARHLLHELIDSEPAANLNHFMSGNDLVLVDPDILGGTPVFRGTRVPIQTLFDYLEDNYTLEQFSDFFPTVTMEMARSVLERSESALLAAI
jgi:uncharacterized protein (DUF433 family)